MIYKVLEGTYVLILKECESLHKNYPAPFILKKDYFFNENELKINYPQRVAKNSKWKYREHYGFLKSGWYLFVKRKYVIEVEDDKE